MTVPGAGGFNVFGLIGLFAEKLNVVVGLNIVQEILGFRSQIWCVLHDGFLSFAKESSLNQLYTSNN